MTTSIHIDRFSAGLDDLTQKQQRDHIQVLRVLAKTGRYSIFEATENQIIAKTMDRLLWKELITVSNGIKTNHGVLLKCTGGDFPWTTCELTEAGKRLIEETLE